LSRDIFHLFCIKKQGLGMRQGKKDGAAAALLEIIPHFGRVTRQDGILGHISDRPLLHAFFDEALCMDIGIPRVFGVAPRSGRGQAVDRISVCLKLKIVGGAFMGTRCGIMSPWGVSFWRRSCPCQP